MLFNVDAWRNSKIQLSEKMSPVKQIGLARIKLTECVLYKRPFN